MSTEQSNEPALNKGKCGIVMPISPNANYPATHWDDVLTILSDAIRDAGFDPSMVSAASESGIIHSRIVENLYANPMVVCDVSSRNPNVMFELGLRLAFDRPTIVIKDDTTDSAFDIAPLEYLEYPAQLRHPIIVKFKAELTRRICATHEKAIGDPNYSVFLKHFQQLKPSKLETTEVAPFEVLRQEIRDLRELVVPKRTSPKAVAWIASDGTTRSIDASLFAKLRLLFESKKDEMAKQYGEGALTYSDYKERLSAEMFKEVAKLRSDYPASDYMPLVDMLLSTA